MLSQRQDQAFLLEIWADGLVFFLEILDHPGELIVVALGLLASAALNLNERGVALVGDVPSGLPSFEVPDVQLVADHVPHQPGARGHGVGERGEAVADAIRGAGQAGVAKALQ